MKRICFCQLIAVSIVLFIGLSGCKKSPKGPTPIPGRTATKVPGDSAPGGPAGRESGSQIPADGGGTRLGQPVPGQTELPGGRFDRSLYNEDRSHFREQTVYFEFDSSAIKAGEQSKIQAVADYLKSEPRSMLDVEGHCDERGTAEYNRALGERRALAIREYLITLGIIGERINTVSYGEDRSADPGHDEIAWAKNRRGEFVLLRPK